MEPELLASILESLLLANRDPLPVDKMKSIFIEDPQPTTQDIEQALETLQSRVDPVYELKHVAGGYYFQIKDHFSQWITRLNQKRTTHYSRSVLETLAIIAYQQPITRAEIEAIRGVAVATTVVKTLLDHRLICAVGQKETPGRPMLYATTVHFLDSLNLKSLDQLPKMATVEDFNELEKTLIASSDHSKLVLSMENPVSAVETVPHDYEEESVQPTETQNTESVLDWA